jgi:hypothetical protein
MLARKAIDDIVSLRHRNVDKRGNPIGLDDIVIIEADDVLSLCMLQPEIPCACNAQSLRR